MARVIEKVVNVRFEDFIFDWDYKTYLLVGGYGSSKSYHVALKLILKAFTEVRKIMVVREVYETIRESCFDLLCEILNEMDLLEPNSFARSSRSKVIVRSSPLQLLFPNGSKFIFKGMDKPIKMKSINGVSIVWIEECSEVKYAGYKEIIGRLRHPTMSLHIILTTNPIREAWPFKHFFKRIDSDGQEVVVLDDERLYEKRTIVKKGVYYHHSVAEDNAYLPKGYLKDLEAMKDYDPDLYMIAKLGRFGVSGMKVLPQFSVAKTRREVMQAVSAIPPHLHFRGFDFGFEESYNALIYMAVDDVEKILYIYKEYYKNHMTDPETAEELVEWDPHIKEKLIKADNEDPKAIRYYQQCGFKIRKCKKVGTSTAGSRLSNTRKVKRFRKIVCSPDCINTIRELQNLSYAKDKNDEPIYDKFNIDPHTFSAIWYGLDDYTVADVKEQIRFSKKGHSA